MNNTEAPTEPIEVWLTPNNVAIHCMIVRDDESTEKRSIRSPVMRGAQREITGDLIQEGYEPVGRWERVSIPVATTLLAVGNLGNDRTPYIRHFQPKNV